MEDKHQHRYEVLRRLAIAGIRGERLQQTAEMAIRQAADLVGLTAASLYLWDDKMSVTLAVSHADSDNARQRLASLEENLFSSLRREQQLLSAYMSFAGEPPIHSFTMPLRYGNDIFGAVIGLQEGERSLVAEDLFLEALSAAIALNVVAEGAGRDKAVSQDARDKERLGAIIETAVTVNHEINNPLTAILGNVQLLLLKKEDLDDELKVKLKTIETAAMQIRDVTQKLLRMTTPRSVEYANGTSMLDLTGKSDRKQDDEPEDES